MLPWGRGAARAKEAARSALAIRRGERRQPRGLACPALEAGVGDGERGRGGPTFDRRVVGLEPRPDGIGSRNGAPGGLALESLDKGEGPAPPRARRIAVVHGELFWYEAFAFEPAQRLLLGAANMGDQDRRFGKQGEPFLGPGQPFAGGPVGVQDDTRKMSGHARNNSKLNLNCQFNT